MVLKLSWPAMGDNEKNCCCMTGSTDAATELVESATLRRTFTAIQSLGETLATSHERKIDGLTLRTAS